MTMTQEQERNLINLRRTKVLELLSKGHTNQAEIARTLNISEPTVSRDIRFLKEQAQKELQTYIQDKIPLEHLKATTGMYDLIRRSNEILDKTADPTTQLQAIRLLTDLYKGVMSLATDAGLIEQSLKRLEVIQDKNEAVFSDKEVKEYYQQEGESASNEDEEPTPTEPEEDIEKEE